MKQLIHTSILIFFGVLTFGGINEVEAADLYNKWKIEYPNVTLISSNSTIVVDYGIRTNELTSYSIQKNIFTTNCSGPDLSEYSEGLLENTLDANTGAHIFRIDPLLMAWDEDIFEPSYANQTASMKFCLRYSLWLDDDDSESIEINYLYTYLTLHFSMGTDFGIYGVLVDSGDQDKPNEYVLQHEANTKIEVYLCDPYTHNRTSAPDGGYTAGDVIAICVEGTENLIEESLIVTGVENFKWTRQAVLNGVPTTMVQWAIKDGVPDPLSEVNCIVADYFCTFTTMLIADFFTQQGVVFGEGNVGIDFASSMGLYRVLRNENSGAAAAAESTHSLRLLEEDSAQQTSGLEFFIPVRGPEDVPSEGLQSPEIPHTGNTWLFLAIEALLVVIALCLSVYLWRMPIYKGFTLLKW